MKPTHHSEGRHNLRDILLAFYSEDWREEKEGGVLHFHGALGNMAAPK